MKRNKILQWIIYISLGIVLFILPFPRGLFFEKEIVLVQIGCFTLFILWSFIKIIKKEKIEMSSFLTISVVLLPIAYILPLLFGVAATYYGALTYIIRYFSYMVIFFVLSDITKTKKQLFLWFNVLAISGVVAAFLGIDAGLGKVINNLFGFKGVIDDHGRVGGVLHYTNSFGAYMGIIFFLLIGLSILANKKYMKAFYSSLQVFTLMALLMTVSRGAIAIVPLIYILLVIFIPTKEKRLEVVLSTIPSIVISLISGRLLMGMVIPIMNGEGEGLIQKGWMIVLVSFVGAFIITFILTQAIYILSKISTKIYQISIGVLGVVAIVGGTLLFTTGLYAKILPQFLVQRFSQIGSLTDITSGRNNFYRDGLHMLKDHWFLGAGGNAWAAMYRQYQSYFYGSSEAHSFPLQMWLETGVFGILIFIFLIIGLFILYFKNRKKENGVEITLVIIPVLMLLSHSLVDFNFSYVSLPIIGFGLMGCMNGMKERKDIDFSITPWFTLLLGIIIIIFPISWQSARNSAVNATKEMTKEKVVAKDVLDASNYMEKAISLNGWNTDYMTRERAPYDPDLRYDLDMLYKDLYDILQEQDQSQIPLLMQKQAKLYKKAYELEPYNPYIATLWAQILIQNGNADEGLKVIEKTVELNPMFSGRYEQLAQAYLAVGEFYAKQGDKESAKPYLERVINVEKDLEEINKRALEKVEMTEVTKGYIERAKQMLQ